MTVKACTVYRIGFNATIALTGALRYCTPGGTRCNWRLLID